MEKTVAELDGLFNLRPKLVRVCLVCSRGWEDNSISQTLHQRALWVWYNSNTAGVAARNFYQGLSEVERDIRLWGIRFAGAALGDDFTLETAVLQQLPADHNPSPPLSCVTLDPAPSPMSPDSLASILGQMLPIPWVASSAVLFEVIPGGPA